MELVALEWMSRFDNQRLLQPIGYIPRKAEATCWLQLASRATGGGLTSTKQPPQIPGRLTFGTLASGCRV